MAISKEDKLAQILLSKVKDDKILITLIEKRLTCLDKPYKIWLSTLPPNYKNHYKKLISKKKSFILSLLDWRNYFEFNSLAKFWTTEQEKYVDINIRDNEDIDIVIDYEEILLNIREVLSWYEAHLDDRVNKHAITLHKFINIANEKKRFSGKQLKFIDDLCSKAKAKMVESKIEKSENLNNKIIDET